MNETNACDRMSDIEKKISESQGFKLVSRDFKPRDTIIKVDDVEIGGDNVVMVAGPCSVENQEQTIEAARAVKESGAKMLRGGAFKPRTSIYAFHGRMSCKSEPGTCRTTPCFWKWAFQTGR